MASNRNKNLGNAGEFYVLAQLAQRGYIARIMSLCPNEFNKFAAKSYIKFREKMLKEKKSFNATYDQYLKNLHYMEVLMFEMRVSLWEMFEAKEKQK